MPFGRLLQALLGRSPVKTPGTERVRDTSDVDRAFSASQNCDVKVSSARSADLEMVPPHLR